jgi:hypothetical protein
MNSLLFSILEADDVHRASHPASEQPPLNHESLFSMAGRLLFSYPAWTNQCMRAGGMSKIRRNLTTAMSSMTAADMKKKEQRTITQPSLDVEWKHPRSHIVYAHALE